MFTFFLLSARFFEMGTRKQTSEATEALLNLKPAIATRLINYHNENSSSIENQASISVAELNLGDYLLVRPGEVLPTDGTVVQGISGINESLITGESLPVTRQIGDDVIGGSTNTENPLVIKVTKLGSDTVLSSIQRLIDEAQHTKPAIAKLADKIASWFVSILLIISAMVAYYWYTTDASQWLEITIATLVVSCPCALSLATPAAITAASGQLAKIGLLPKRAHALETLAHATDFVFDKTGTLTEGKIKLEEIILTSHENENNTYTKQYLLNIAASLEANSEHPIAKALLTANQNTLLAIQNLKHTTGQGIQGIINNEEWFIGNDDFIQQHCAVTFENDNLDTNKSSKIFLANSKSCLAIFVLSDSIRTEAKSLINQLHQSGQSRSLNEWRQN